MKKNTIFPSFLLLLAAMSGKAIPGEQSIGAIRQAITASGARWQAEENWVTRLTLEEQRLLCAAWPLQPASDKNRILRLPRAALLPAKFDWRNNGGDWTTPVKNQGNCGSCWIFGSLAQVESWWKIHNNLPGSMIDLSEQFVLSCEQSGSCNGGNIQLALDFYQTTGVPTEVCMAYKATDAVDCSTACPDWQNEAMKIPGWAFVTLEKAVIDDIKNALLIQPVTSVYLVYQDFMSYSKGVYSHVTGTLLGSHNVLITGWDDAEKCWICKNSWGLSWGEKGYFRIKWNDCGIGMACTFIWDQNTSIPALALAQDSLQISMTMGDTLTLPVSIHNQSPEPLTFTVISEQLDQRPYFHTDTFNAWNGLSWWCGDPDLGGYESSSLQYLETPLLDLASAQSPGLNFKGFWALEVVDDPLGLPIFYDGWDGCNVWASTDGGQSFQVMAPLYPAYTSRSLYSFGVGNYLGPGKGTPGWNGKNGEWESCAFDLTPYKSDQTVIRFAFASDPGLSTSSDSTLLGFFLDDIQISDQGHILFENHGDSAAGMHTAGYTATGVDWLTAQQGFGHINPNDSSEINLHINSHKLVPDEYLALLYFSSNDTMTTPTRLFVSLDLQAPDCDIALVEDSTQAGDCMLLMTIHPQAQVRNCGKNDAESFSLSCSMTGQKGIIYADTIGIASLISGQSKVVHFSPFIPLMEDTLQMTVSLLPPAGDYNDWNNRLSKAIHLSNLVDDFEIPNGLWSFSGGWGITNRFRAHSGKQAAHINHGITPYENNMNAFMTFSTGFSIKGIDSSAISFWAMGALEKDHDFCRVEVSGDSLNWIQMASLTDVIRNYTHFEISLEKLITAGYRRAWLRFHFISDSAQAFTGILIDDVEIHVYKTSTTPVTDKSSAPPTEFYLAQNYPNPFNPGTTLEWSMSRSEQVRLDVYDLLGRKVKTLVDARREAGKNRVFWDGTDDNAQAAAAGVYFCRIVTGSRQSRVVKMILLR